MSRFDIALGKTPEPVPEEEKPSEYLSKSDQYASSRRRALQDAMQEVLEQEDTPEESEAPRPWHRAVQALPPIRPLPEGYVSRSGSFSLVGPGGSRVIIPINNLQIDFGPRSMTIHLSPDELHTLHEDINAARNARARINR